MSHRFDFISEFVPSWYNTDKELKQDIIKMLYKYSIRVNNTQDVKKSFNKMIPARTISQLRNYIINNWELSVALRLATYSCVINKLDHSNDIVNTFKAWSLSEKEAELYMDLMFDSDIYKLDSVVEKLQQPIPTPKELIQKCTLLVNSPTITSFIGKLVYRKLRIFAESNHLSLKDFEQELSAMAIQCYYNATPHLSATHLVNHIKKCIKHKGHSMIYYYASKCRSRIIPWSSGETAKDITNIVRDISGLLDNDIDSSYLYNQERKLQLNEIIIDYRTLLEGCSESQKKALRLMLMDKDDKFRAWYGHIRKRQFNSMYDIFRDHNESPELYFTTIRNYLGVPSHLFNSWRSKLAS